MRRIVENVGASRGSARDPTAVSPDWQVAKRQVSPLDRVPSAVCLLSVAFLSTVLDVASPHPCFLPCSFPSGILLHALVICADSLPHHHRAPVGSSEMGCGDLMCCSDPMPCGASMGYSEPMGSGDFMGCGDPMNDGDPMGPAALPALKPVEARGVCRSRVWVAPRGAGGRSRGGGQSGRRPDESCKTRRIQRPDLGAGAGVRGPWSAACSQTPQ